MSLWTLFYGFLQLPAVLQIMIVFMVVALPIYGLISIGDHKGESREKGK